MLIDAKKLKEVYLRGSVHLLSTDERFYIVPGASNYALSDYGRLFNLKTNRAAKRVKDRFADTLFRIRFDTNDSEQVVSIEQLISLVFFGGKKMRFGFSFGYSDPRKRWKVTDLHIIKSRKQRIEYIRAKIEHRKPHYNIRYQGNQFVNRMNLTRSQAATIYNNAKGRANRMSVKKAKPHYKNTTMEVALINDPYLFYKWLLDNQYYYPDKLELDKDILKYGKTDTYSRGNMCLVPRRINDFFRPTSSHLGYGIRKKKIKGKEYYFVPTSRGKSSVRCDTYIDALVIGRKIKADKIRNMVKEERELGYIPANILRAMMRWATLCEKGKISMWEPKLEVNKGANK